jgi:hypothetical protein
MLRRILLLMLTAHISGCTVNPKSTETKNLSDQYIREMINSGEFALKKNGVWIEYARHYPNALLCELVQQERREIVVEVLSANQESITGYSLLACAPTQDAYDFWKSHGASNRAIGDQSLISAPDDFWSFMLPGQSISIAAANANLASVVAHLKDGVSVNERGGLLGLPIGAALSTWYQAKTSPPEEGYPRGLNPEIIGLGWNIQQTIYGIEFRNRPSDAIAAERIVRLLLEAGASLDSVTGQGYIAQNGLGDGIWESAAGRTYREEYSKKLPEILNAERYARHTRSLNEECEKNSREACSQLLVDADPLSTLRGRAEKQIAAIDKEANEWSELVAKQPCKLNDSSGEWVYLGSDCLNGLAHGSGKAVNRDRRSELTGTFERGGFVFGRTVYDGEPIFEGAYNNGPDGPGICWYNGEPEQCHLMDGKRVDSLHKQRIEFANQQQAIREREERQREEELQLQRSRAYAEAERRRQEMQEARAERQQQMQMAATINSINSGGTGNASVDQALRNFQDIDARARDLQMRQENERRRAADAQREAELQASYTQNSSSTQDTSDVQRELQRQQQAREDAKRREQERQAREAEEQLKAQAEALALEQQKAREKAEKEARERAEKEAEQQAKNNYLNELKRGTKLFARKCPDGEGKYYVVGLLPKVKPKEVSCVDLYYRASCPGGVVYTDGVGKNFVGIATDCFMGDSYTIEPKPSCKVEEITMQVLDIKECQ